MKEHYNFSDETYAALLKSGVKVKHLFKTVELFDPYKTGGEINFTGLLYYIDSKGDFDQPPNFPHKRIAKAFFNQLPIGEKIAAAEYIEWKENDFDPDFEGE